MMDALSRRQAGWDRRWLALCLLALGVSWAASTIASQPLFLLAGTGCCLYVLFATASLREPFIFVVVFLVVLIILPPFFFTRLGETPVYVSSLLVPIGLAIVVARLPDFNFRLDPVAKGLGLFLVGTGISLPFAFWFSGGEIATQSLLRWLMLAQAGLAYVLVRGGARVHENRVERRIIPILLVAAVATAGYGIFDFYWPVALPHPSADQFIWLENAVVRRAQGVFYESSNFANLCGFFLVIASAAYLSRQERAFGIPRPWLLFFIAVLTLAVFVAFSRSAWASVLGGLLVFIAVSGKVKFRRASPFFVALGFPLALLWAYSPELWNYFVASRVGYLGQILTDPNLASSGRFETWARVLAIVRDHPLYLLFGVGFKTLPFTRLFHEEIITDNGFLNLLLETGLLGFASFVFFSVAVFRTFLNLARRSQGIVAFWGAALFSFWCGEWIQMMAVDAYTYWRNMTVFLALMALTVSRAERAAISPDGKRDDPPIGTGGGRANG